MIIPTNPDPLHFDNSSASVITLPASNSHPHMALQHDQEVLVPDVVSRVDVVNMRRL